ncbi:MAG: hypothetical protein P8016_11245, partial [Sedimentisphaerales bacterium]
MNSKESNQNKLRLSLVVILATIFAATSCHTAKPAKTSQVQPSTQAQTQEQLEPTLAEPLSGMPGYAQYQKMSGQMRGAVGRLFVKWADNGKAVDFVKG